MIGCSSVCVYLTPRVIVIFDDFSVCNCPSVRCEVDD